MSNYKPLIEGKQVLADADNLLVPSMNITDGSTTIDLTALPTMSHTHDMGDMDDVSGTPSGGDTLKWDATNQQWEFVTNTIPSDPTVPEPPSGATYSFNVVGYDSNYSNKIQYMNSTTTTFNATDGGDDSTTRYWGLGISGSEYGFVCAGYNGSWKNEVTYVSQTNFSSNTTDKGDITLARYISNNGINAEEDTYGYTVGGYNNPNQNIVEYINCTTTTGGAPDAGDLVAANRIASAVRNATYGFIMGGIEGAVTNRIQTLNYGTTSITCTDRGNLTANKYGGGTCYGETYGYYMGYASVSNVIDYLYMPTVTSNAADKGDLTLGRHYSAGMNGNNGTYGYCSGGYTPNTTVIDYINKTTTSGNAVDCGDLAIATRSHGGLF